MQEWRVGVAFYARLPLLPLFISPLQAFNRSEYGEGRACFLTLCPYNELDHAVVADDGFVYDAGALKEWARRCSREEGDAFYVIPGIRITEVRFAVSSLAPFSSVVPFRMRSEGVLSFVRGKVRKRRRKVEKREKIATWCSMLPTSLSRRWGRKPTRSVEVQTEPPPSPTQYEAPLSNSPTLFIHSKSGPFRYYDKRLCL